MLAGGFAATLLLALLTSILALLLLGCLGYECCGCGFAANCCYQALPKKKNVLLRRSGSGSGQQEEGGRREGEKEDPCPIFHTNISYKKLRAWCSERNRGYGSGLEEE
jgi:hypothetical protein